MSKRIRLIIPSTILMLSLLLAGCAAGGRAQNSGSSNFTGTGTVAKVSYTDSVESSGQIQPQRIASLTWSTSGSIARVNVAAGQSVKAGETLMSLDPGSVPANLLTAQTDLTNAKNALSQLTNPDASTVASAQSGLAAAYSSYQQAQASLSNAILSNQTANSPALYSGWQAANAALQTARNTLPLANASIDVQAYFQAVRDTSRLQSELKTAQDNASAHPSDAALAQKSTDLGAALLTSQTRQADLQTLLTAQTTGQVTDLSAKLSDYDSATRNFIGSVITDTTSGSVSLAQVQADLASKQSALISTQSNLTDQVNRRAGMNGKRCDDATISDYQKAYDLALAIYNHSDHTPNSPEFQALERASANLNWCTAVWSQPELSAADANIASTQAQIQLLQAQISQDQAQISDAGASVYGLAINLNTAWAAYQDATQKLNSAVTRLYELQRIPNADDLAAAQARLQAAQAAVDSLSLRAPYDGVVTSINYLPGDVVDMKSVAAVIVDRSKLVVDLQVDESSVVKLQQGDKATIVLEALPDKKLTGVLETINPVGSSSQGAVYYTVRVALDQADASILIGATADVTLQAGQPRDVLTVPVSAVQNDAQGEFVYRVAQDGSSQRVAVVSGQILANDQVVVSGDLKEGDSVGLIQSTTTGGGGRFFSP